MYILFPVLRQSLNLLLSTKENQILCQYHTLSCTRNSIQCYRMISYPLQRALVYLGFIPKVYIIYHLCTLVFVGGGDRKIVVVKYQTLTYFICTKCLKFYNKDDNSANQWINVHLTFRKYFYKHSNVCKSIFNASHSGFVRFPPIRINSLENLWVLIRTLP